MGNAQGTFHFWIFNTFLLAGALYVWKLKGKRMKPTVMSCELITTNSSLAYLKLC